MLMYVRQAVHTEEHNWWAVALQCTHSENIRHCTSPSTMKAHGRAPCTKVSPAMSVHHPRARHVRPCLQGNPLSCMSLHTGEAFGSFQLKQGQQLQAEKAT